ncbi:MAG: tripartite tricarboxylate transporter substrate binding protein [Bradyrhizobiaceae bacterium]|nr:MAG: tripartite tricarboxylate transporter substrate binding protein [Bradyrhizobiaceae bacterium]
MRHLIIGFAMLALSLTPARADSYPDRPVTLVVPYAAGGTTDVLGRLLAKALGAELKQTVIVENVGGAGGTLGTQRVVRSKPDGYTLNFGNMGSMAASVPLYPNIGLDTRKDLVGIGVFANVPMMISVSRKSGIASLGELIARMKEQRGRVTFGHSGASSTAQLAAAMLLYLTETKATLVPYRGSGPAIQDLIAGNIDAVIDQTVTMIPAHQNGLVRSVGVSGPQRLAQVPDVPTFAEGNVPKFDLQVWNALAAPAGTPPAVIAVLEAALAKSLENEEVKARFAELAAQAPPKSELGGAALQNLIRSEVDRWTAIIKEAKLDAQ